MGCVRWRIDHPFDKLRAGPYLFASYGRAGLNAEGTGQALPLAAPEPGVEEVPHGVAEHV